MKGAYQFVVRDITDVLHPKTISTFDGLGEPQFVNAAALSYGDQAGLFRMPLSGTPRTLVGRCASSNANWSAWSPDGTAAAYVTGNPNDSHLSDLHVVRGGFDRVVASTSIESFAVGCESRSCADNWDVRLLYSPDGAFISLVQMVPVPVLRVWTAEGKLVKSLDSTSTTMSVWSGNSLYWRDDKGVERWSSGAQTLLLPGVSWIRPRASPAGGQIVYETRDPGYSTSHVYLLDTVSGAVRGLKSSRSEPAFLNSHLIWYKGERPCVPSDPCPFGPTTDSGKTYIYDLRDGSETESIIGILWDVWPHPA